MSVPDDVLVARAYLSRVAEPPAPGLAALLRSRPDPVDAAARIRAADPTLSPLVLAETSARRATDRADADLADVTGRGGRLLVPEDPGWPAWAMRDFGPAAQRCHEGLVPPVALWARGPLEITDAPYRTAAVVGARAATDYGLFVAGDWAAGLADAGVTVVSGAALGIDGAAHRGALAAGGPTIAVLACGVDRAYPPSHARLLDRIAADGLVVSEYPPGAVPGKQRFLVRNRLVAGLAAGTLVVEAGARSGAQRTALVARCLGRALMVVPGPVTSALSIGCHELARRPEALLVGCVEHVVEAVGALGDDLAAPPRGPARETDPLSTVARRVHDAFRGGGGHTVERLAYDAGTGPETMSVILAELAAAGLVRRDGERWFRTPD